MKIASMIFLCSMLLFIAGCESRAQIHENALQDMGLTQLTPMNRGRYRDGSCYAKDKYDNCYFVIVSITSYGDTIAAAPVPCKPFCS